MIITYLLFISWYQLLKYPIDHFFPMASDWTFRSRSIGSGRHYTYTTNIFQLSVEWYSKCAVYAFLRLIKQLDMITILLYQQNSLMHQYSVILTFPNLFATDHISHISMLNSCQVSHTKIRQSVHGIDATLSCINDDNRLPKGWDHHVTLASEGSTIHHKVSQSYKPLTSTTLCCFWT